MRIFLWLILSAQAFGAGLDHYAQLIVNDSRAKPGDGVRVTYLVTNGYQLEFNRLVPLAGERIEVRGSSKRIR